MITDCTYIIIDDKKYTIGDKVKYGIDLNTDKEMIFTEGFVTFGKFSAEIYTCYGFFVANEKGDQVSEAGLTSEYQKF
jgi:hypothetical protein